MKEEPRKGDFFWGAEEQHTGELGILKNVSEIAKEHETTNSNGRVPQLVWHHKFTNPTSAVQKASLCAPAPTKGSRVLYILIFHKLRPITELRYGEDLFSVWHQCILCHLTLWKEGVYHRDVSPGNMTWYWKDGKRIGVLNDCDLFSLADDPGPQGNERAGTVPFMALDLLIEEGQRGEVKHLYRHDLESFIWCFAWISLRYKEGVLLPRGLRPFDEWATLGAIACGEKKYFFQGHMKPPARSHIDSSLWVFLVGCFMVLKKDAENRYYLSLERPSQSGAGQQPNAEELDPDAFLSKFTCSQSWIAPSKPSK